MVLWLAPQPLVLASRSDIRGKILAAAGLRFEIRPSQINERAVEMESGIADAAAVARHLARAKAQAIASSLPGRLVLGADQTL
ncbi:MAG: Maf family protein, partial [Pseudolabrys sp.]